MKKIILASKGATSNPEVIQEYEKLPNIDIFNNLYYVLNKLKVLDDIFKKMINYNINVDQYETEYKSWNESEKTVELQTKQSEYINIKSEILNTITNYCDMILSIKKLEVLNNIDNLSNENLNLYSSFRKAVLNKKDHLILQVNQTSSVSELLEINYDWSN